MTSQSRHRSGPFVLADSGVDSTSVTLRLFGDDLDPEAVSAALGSEPTLSRRKGDAVPDESAPRVADTGSWLLSSQQQSKSSLESQIALLFDRLTDDLSVWRDLCSRYHVDLFCGLWCNDWNRGLELSSEIVQAIAARGLRIGYDIYFVDSGRSTQ